MISNYIWTSIAVLVLCLRLVSGYQQHFVCKNLEDVFVESGSSEAEPRYGQKQGAPGKMGPPGVPGPVGSPGNDGQPGTVDYDRINEVIRTEVDNNLAGIRTTIAGLTRNLSVRTSEDDCRTRGGLVYSGKCFTVPYVTSTFNMTYDLAAAECTKHGALLAEIHNRSQQTTLMDFATTKIPAGTSDVFVWLGMEYKHTTSTLLYRSGMETHSNQFGWYPGYPSSSSSYKYMIMAVRNDGGSYIGIYNSAKSNKPQGVMCEKDV